MHPGKLLFTHKRIYKLLRHARTPAALGQRESLGTGSKRRFVNRQSVRLDKRRNDL